jgi:hypothetical protein
MKRHMRPLLLPSITLLLAGGLHAQLADWSNPSGGDYRDPANWTNEVLPSADHPVQFTFLNNTYTVRLTQDETVGRFFNRGGNITFDLNGFDFTVRAEIHVNTFNFDSGFFGQETIWRGGRIFNQGDTNIGGSNTGMARHVIVEGAGTKWQNDGIMRVGTNTMFSGSTVSDHSFTVRDGASVTQKSGSEFVVGANSGAHRNLLRVTGEGSSLSIGGHLNIGPRNVAGEANRVLVKTGGSLEASGIQIGRGSNTGSRFEVAGEGTSVQAAFLQVGANPSSGNVYEQTGGLVRVNEARGLGVTYFLVATAGNEVNFLGGETRIERQDGAAYLRTVGGSTITIEGGDVHVDEIRRLATDGEILLRSGQLTAKKAVYGNAPAPFVVGSGEGDGAVYRLAGGAHVFGGTSGLVIATDGELTGHGTLSGAVQVQGEVRPTGAISVAGPVEFAAGSAWVVDLEQEASPIDVTGSLLLNSVELQVLASEGFAPALGTTFAVGSWSGSLGGTFADLPEGALLPIGQVHLKVSYGTGSEGSIVLTVVDPDAAPGESYAEWVVRIGVESAAGPKESAAGDGIPNLVKYAAGLNPLVPASPKEFVSLAVEQVEAERYLTLTVARDFEATQASMGAEVSSNLTEWLGGEEDVELVEIGEGHLVFRDKTPMGENGRRFIRLRVTLE